MISIDRNVYLRGLVKSIESTMAVTMESGEAGWGPWQCWDCMIIPSIINDDDNGTHTCLGFSTCLNTRWTAKMSMSSRIRPIRTPPPIVRYLNMNAYITLAIAQHWNASVDSFLKPVSEKIYPYEWKISENIQKRCVPKNSFSVILVFWNVL